eukprot:GGOE01011180.1.p1 GENE.GGOE01011180.1~~GGOE01011180.1.p1  ORF type:complete len:696 (+),score=195.35 GGOE01011180.1:35-2089(+)
MNEVVDTFAGLMETVVADFKDVASSYALELRSELATKASSALTTVVTTRATGLQRFQSMYELGVLHPSRAASDPVTNDDCLLLAAVCDGALEFGYWETLNLVSAAGRFYSCVPGEGALLSVLSIDGSHYNESHETWLPNSVQGKMRQRCMSEQPISTTVGENCSLPQNCQCGSDQRCSLWYTPHLADSTPRLLVSDVYVGKYGTPQFTLSYPVVNSSDASSPVLAVASTEFAFTSVATYLASLSVSNSTYLAALLNDTNLSIMGSLGRKCGTNETAPGDPGLPLWSALRACDSNTREVAQWLLQHRSTIQQSCTVELSGIIWNIFPDSSTVVAYFCIVGTKKEDLYRAIDSSDAKAASQLSTVRLQQLGKVAASGKATQAYMTVVQAENIQEVQAMQDSYLEQMEELEASSRSTLTASQQNSTAEVEHLMISQTSEVDQLKAKHLDALAAATGWTIAVVFAILIVVLLLSAWGTVRITRSLTHIIELMEDVAEMRVEDLELPQNSHVTEVARIQSAFRVLIARLTEYKGYMPAGLLEDEEEEEEEGEVGDGPLQPAGDATVGDAPQGPLPSPAAMAGKEGEGEESFLVLLELPELQGMRTSLAGAPLRIIGVDEDKPLLQLGSWVFEGRHDFAIGSRMLFGEQPAGPPDAPRSKVSLQYDSTVHKIISFQRVFLQPYGPGATLT